MEVVTTYIAGVRRLLAIPISRAYDHQVTTETQAVQDLISHGKVVRLGYPAKCAVCGRTIHREAMARWFLGVGNTHLTCTTNS